MEKESIFLSYVRLTLKKWAGFQAAIEEGMGGPYAKEKELWMGTEIENYFKKYSRVIPDDIEEYIAAMMENEFDTYFEDESLLEISKKFCEAYELSKINPNSTMFEEVLKRPEPSSISQSCSRQSSQSEKVTEEKTDIETSVVPNMEQLSINGTDEAEWTLVTRKSHKK